ncbi:unnamed protein product [Chrysodeixis includens]|uniref:Uncharacterized protein n=1 Tax=Chrysodeixis includens TaxID=689277 RepID=A0A9N8L3X5_CHRIL|nr:unnamed protein product [Chrysodeixis includens]
MTLKASARPLVSQALVIDFVNMCELSGACVGSADGCTSSLPRGYRYPALDATFTLRDHLPNYFKMIVLHPHLPPLHRTRACRLTTWKTYQPTSTTLDKVAIFGCETIQCKVLQSVHIHDVTLGLISNANIDCLSTGPGTAVTMQGWTQPVCAARRWRRYVAIAIDLSGVISARRVPHSHFLHFHSAHETRSRLLCYYMISCTPHSSPFSHQHNMFLVSPSGKSRRCGNLPLLPVLHYDAHI